MGCRLLLVVCSGLRPRLRKADPDKCRRRGLGQVLHSPPFHSVVRLVEWHVWRETMSLQVQAYTRSGWSDRRVPIRRSVPESYLVGAGVRLQTRWLEGPASFVMDCDCLSRLGRPWHGKGWVRGRHVGRRPW